MNIRCTLKSGRLLVSALSILVLSVIAGLGTYVRMAPAIGVTEVVFGVYDLDRDVVESHLARVELDLVSLTLMGCPSERVLTTLSAACEWLNVSGDVLEAADHELALARSSVSEMRMALRRGQGQYKSTDLVLAEEEVRRATASLDSQLTSFFKYCSEHLTVEEMQIHSLLSGSRQWAVSKEYRLLSLDESDWLAMERCSRFYAGECTQADLDLQAAAMRATGYATARVNIETCSAITEATFEQFWQ